MKYLIKSFILFTLLVVGAPAVLGQYGIGTNSPNPAAAVDVSSTTLGFLPPRMSTSQLTTLAGKNPANGLMVFDTDQHCLVCFTNNVARPVFLLPPVLLPTAGKPVIDTNTGIATYTYAGGTGSNSGEGASVWKWWRTDNNAILSVTTACPKSCKSQTVKFSVTPVDKSGRIGLTVTSDETTIQASSSVTISHDPSDGISPTTQSITYSFYNPWGTCWLDRNLGAVTKAGGASDNSPGSAGWYWQFNTLQGYSVDASNVRNPATWGSNTNSGNTDWQPINDPCKRLLGLSWHVPCIGELESVCNQGSFHCAGYLNSDAYTPSGYGRGLYYSYWTSNQDGVGFAHVFTAGSGASLVDVSFSKVNANSVRCVQDQ